MELETLYKVIHLFTECHRVPSSILASAEALEAEPCSDKVGQNQLLFTVPVPLGRLA